MQTKWWCWWWWWGWWWWWLDKSAVGSVFDVSGNEEKIRRKEINTNVSAHVDRSFNQQTRSEHNNGHQDQNNYLENWKITNNPMNNTPNYGKRKEIFCSF